MRHRLPLSITLGLVLALVPTIARANAASVNLEHEVPEVVETVDEAGADPHAAATPSATVPAAPAEEPGSESADEPATDPTPAAPLPAEEGQQPATDVTVETPASSTGENAQVDAPASETPASDGEETPAETQDVEPQSETSAETTASATSAAPAEPLGAPAAPEAPAAAPALENNAVYTFSAANAPSLNVAATSSDDAQLAKKSTLLGEYWRAVNNGDGSFMLVNLDGSRALAVSGTIKSGANVIVSQTGTRWVLVKNADGKTYTVIPLGHSGLCLDIKGGGKTAGTTVQLHSTNGTAAQSFLFTLNEVLTEAVTHGTTLSGPYTVKPASNSSLSLDIASGSKTAGANLRLWSANGSLAQTYDLTSLGNGLYAIRAGHSGKCLEVQGGSTTAGANVRQWNRNNTLAQIWYLVAEEGGYRIRNAKSGLALDIAGATPAKSANVQLGSASKSASQVFALTQTSYLANGSVYTFSPQNATSLLMAVAGNSASTSAAIKTANSSAVLGQYWRVKLNTDGSLTLVNLRSNAGLAASSNAKAATLKVSASAATPLIYALNDDGTFSFRLKSNPNLVIDVKSGSTSAGAALQLWTSNGSKAQKFAFSRNATLSAAATLGANVSDGIYRIGIATSPSFVLDIADGSKESGGNLRLWQSNNSLAQKYQLISVGNGLYTIQAAHSGKLLGITGGSTSSGANVQQSNRTNVLSQYWYLLPVGGGGYSIRNAKSGLALDATGGKIAKGTNLQLHSYNGGVGQHYAMTSVPLLNDGTYAFSSALTEYGMLALDMAGGSTSAGGNAQVYQSNGSVAQKWVVTHVGNGTYTIKNAKSGLYLEVAGGSTEKGGNVQQGKSTGSQAKWVIGITDEGGLTFMNVKSGMYLDVKSGKVANGTNVQQWTHNGSRSQGWVINTHHTTLPSGKLGTFVRKMVYYADIASVGYDQSNRWDIRDGGECDCSSLVITCLKEAGFATGTSTYTGDMSYNLTARGWKRIGFNINNVKPGDILLNDYYHVCVVISGTGKNALIAQASIDENGNAMYGKAGDQSGYETNIKKVYTYSSGWDCILRYS